jgi:hypothetical protein
MSSYVSSDGSGGYSLDTGAISAAYNSKGGMSFGQALETGIEASLEVATIVDLAVGAAIYATEFGVDAAVTLITTVATGTAAAATAAASTLIATGAAAGGIAGVTALIPLVLLAAWPAQAGPGCCGTQQLTPDQAKALLNPGGFGPPPTQDQINNMVSFGTCDPGQFNDWSRQLWTNCDGAQPWTGSNAPTDSPDYFLDTLIQLVFLKTSTCWSIAPPLGPILARGVEAWNNTHSPSTTRTISFPVNTTCPSTYQNTTSTSTGQPFSTEPMAVALNQSAMVIGPNNQLVKFIVPPNSRLGFTVNTGPLVPGGVHRPIRGPRVPMVPASPSGSSGTSTAAVLFWVAAGAAALGAGSVYLYGRKHHMTFGQSFKALTHRRRR